MAHARERGWDGPSTTNYTAGIKVERRLRSAGGFTYEATSNPYRLITDASMGWTLRLSDAAGRFKSETAYSGEAAPMPDEGNENPMGTTTVTYNGATTTTTAPEGLVTTAVRDALGRQVSANAGELSTASYTYDALDNLIGVTQASQTRTFNYSSLSRLTSATQPENGQTLYTYDDSGNLLSRQDARGAAGKSEFLKPAGSAATEKAYDGLGRPRRKQIMEGTTAKYVDWTWDTATKGKGRLGSVSYGTTTVSYTGYDSLGRVTGHKQTTDNIDYPFTYSYFGNDELKTIGYPSGRVVTYTVDAAGRPNSAMAFGNEYVKAATYGAHGAPTEMDLAGGKLRVSNAYNGKLQTEEIWVKKMPASATLVKLEYDYHVTAATENNGNPRVQRMNDGVTTRTQNYGFDAANRVSSMGETGGASLTFNYDSYNNLWVTAPAGSPPHPARAVSAQTAYNAAKNQFVLATMGEDGWVKSITTSSDVFCERSFWGYFWIEARERGRGLVHCPGRPRELAR